MSDQLSHVNEKGEVQMVGVGQKRISNRKAKASGEVKFDSASWKILNENDFALKKGDLISTVKLAGIMGAKQTPNLIPLCHPLALEKIDLDIKITELGFLITSEVEMQGKTGVEMEAITAVSVACLTVYDMCKGISHDIRIQNIQLEHKSGGKRNFSR